MKEQLSEIVKIEIDSGIPPERIIFGGFSMGGTMSLHMTFANKTKWNFPGCFVMSSFLSHNSSVYDAIKSNELAKHVKVFMYHGKNDKLVLFDWAKSTRDILSNLGNDVQFHEDKRIFHELAKCEIKMLKNWVLEILPETES